MENKITAAAPGKLTPAQQRIWVLSQFEGVHGAYNQVFGVRLDGVLDYPAFDRAVFALVARHESLRTLFPAAGSEPYRHVLDAGPLSLPSPVTDVTGRENPGQAIGEIISHEADFEFDLSRFPLFRHHLIKTGGEQHICIFNLHLIAGDEVSREVLLRDFCQCYERARAGNGETVGQPETRAEDYAGRQERPMDSERLRQQQAHWHLQVALLPPALPLPFDRARTVTGFLAADTVGFTLDSGQTGALRALAQESGCGLDALLLAVYNVLLGKLCNREAVSVGIPVAGRRGSRAERLVGLLENILVMSNTLAPDDTFRAFLAAVSRTLARALEHQEYPYAELVKMLPAGTDPRRGLVNAMFLLEDRPPFTGAAGNLTVTPYPCRAKAARCELFLHASPAGDGLALRFEYAAALFDRATVEMFVAGFRRVVSAAVANPDRRIATIDIVGEAQQAQLLNRSGNLPGARPGEATVVASFEAQVRRGPGRMAVACRGRGLTYGELNEQANRLAHCLREKHGVKPGDLVAITGESSEKMVAGLLGILKAGGVCVPVDPALSQEETAHILADSAAPVLLATERVPPPAGYPGQVLHLDGVESGDAANPNVAVAPGDLCGLLYTAGPAGKPPGVMVTHANLANLCAGLGAQLASGGEACLIAPGDGADPAAVLGLLWPLCNGAEVVIHPRGAALAHLDRYVSGEDLSLDFSLFFFANYNVRDDDKYRLLLEAVKYADGEGFKGVWTPERHFHEFGALFPNPAVTSAALAMITSRMTLRSGSIVSPLHDAVRIAEEWSVVDNLSGGRVELSFAPGWNINDFALAKDNYADRHAIMYRQIADVQRLWRGESIKRDNGVGKEIEVRTFPSPIQPALPVWITAAGNESTFITAGEKGANVLTHLLGQDMQELARKISLYREARKRSGFSAASGKVAVMLHTYVGDDIREVERIVEKPFTEYLKSAIGLSKILYEEAGLKEEDIPEEDKAIMLRHSFRRYYQSAALIGTPDSCSAMVKKMKGIGVDEIACLVDFGIEQDAVMAGLRKLNSLKDLFVDHRLRTHKPVTVMQTTPAAMARMGEATGSDALLKAVQLLLLDGEAVPGPLPAPLRDNSWARVLNAYGFAEATAATALYGVAEPAPRLRSGQFVGNARVYLLNKALQLVPPGVEGDLYVGGESVSPGYWKRPQQTGKRFAPDPFRPGGTMFRTGDTGRWLPDGSIGVTRKAGGANAAGNPAAAAYAAPATETEAKLVAVWSGLLAADEADIGVNSSFFALGGDALRAIRLRDEIAGEFGVNTGLGEMYNNPTVRRMARVLEERGVQRIPLIPAAGTREEYPASFAQDRLYHRQMAQPDKPANHVLGAYELPVRYDLHRLQQCVQQLAGRHPVLRTGFRLSGDRLMQRISERAAVELPVLNGPADRTAAEAIAGFARPFDLSAPPLLRCAVLRREGRNDLLLVDVNRIACDPVSLGILMQDLRRMYRGDALAPLPLRYADYACWQKDPAQAPEKQRAFWAEKLSGILPEIDLPVVQGREAVDGYQLERQVLEISGELYHKNQQLGADAGVPGWTILLAAYYIFLSKVTEQTDLVVGIETPGRRQAALSSLAGPFAKGLPLRIQVADGTACRDLVDEVRYGFRQALENQEFPYEELFSDPDGVRKEQIASVYFSPGAGAGRQTDPGEPEFRPAGLEAQDDAGAYEFGLEIHEGEGWLDIHFVYCGTLYDSDTIGLFREYYRNILLAVLEDPRTSIRDIELENSLRVV